jgi:hypothetical protein
MFDPIGVWLQSSAAPSQIMPELKRPRACADHAVLVARLDFFGGEPASPETHTQPESERQSDRATERQRDRPGHSGHAEQQREHRKPQPAQHRHAPSAGGWCDGSYRLPNCAPKHSGLLAEKRRASSNVRLGLLGPPTARWLIG